ncbi:hypothetical protein CRYUN_Cryun21dG0056500 [Craigia yunnanensis]
MDIMKHGKLVPYMDIMKLDAVSNSKRLSFRQQQVLLQFEYQGEKAVPSSCNISVWQPENEDAYPKFELYLDATEWATVTIQDASRIYVNEMIIRAPSDSIDICICCATTVSPFISTLELRPLNLSVVNFGALTTDVVRYPDDSYDRVWESDLDRRQKFSLTVLNAIRYMSAESVWANEGGDPCVPAHWEWVKCSSTIPPRIKKMWLDSNSLTGPLPDMSNLLNLKIVHLENNKLTGPLPSYFNNEESTRCRYIQNNSFSGEIPPSLLSRKISCKQSRKKDAVLCYAALQIYKQLHVFSCNYEGNPGLHNEAQRKMHFKLILGTSIGVIAVLLVLFLGSLILLRNLEGRYLA